MKAFALALAGLVAGTGAAAADGVAPFEVPFGNAEFTLGGEADAAAIEHSGGAGALRLNPQIERDYDSGLVVAFKGTLLAFHDRLTAGRYGGHVIEKLTGELQTGLGRLAIGETDGAGEVLAVGMPKVDETISLDYPEMVLFRDPSTNRAFRPLPLASAVTSSSDYAKFVYASPTLFGVTLALSFSPSEGNYVLPFLHEGPQVANRQVDIWEGALRYSDDFGPVTLSAYGAAAEGRAEHKTAGHEGLSDLAAGVRADYAASDDLTLSLGGGFRRTNAYAFNINDAVTSGSTEGFSGGASARYGSWVTGVEYGSGIADAVPGSPRLSLTGYQISLGYDFTPNIRITTGWQRQDYARSIGVFYNGASRVGVDAGFLHLDVHV